MKPISPPSTLDHARLVSDFSSKTGADSSNARRILEEHRWDIESAVKQFKIVKTAQLPPVGPRKNIEPAQVNGKNISPSNTLDYRKLKRGLSKTTDNVQIVHKARECVLQDIQETQEDQTGLQHFVDTPEYTFILPDLTKFPEDFRAFLHKDLIETATLVSLEQAGRLNWWADIGACRRLLPLATTGDGNCLLHAASLGMWGFHDRQLTLRRSLYKTLSAVKGSFWRRWRWHQTQINKQSGLILSEPEWQAEWNSLLKLASTAPRVYPGSTNSCCDSPATKGLMEREDKDVEPDSEVFYESLEEFHVFVLAHVLRRPVVIVADTVLKNSSGEPLAPIPFGGVYLPLECRPSQCHRSPLILTYDAAHFSALVPMEGDNPNGVKHADAIPVVDPELNLLPVHFLVDPGSQFTWNSDEKDVEVMKEMELMTEEKLNIMQQYLDLIKVPIPSGSQTDGASDSSEGSRPRSNSWSGPKGPIQRSGSIDSTESNQSSGINSINNLNSVSGSSHSTNNATHNNVKNNAKTEGKDSSKDISKDSSKDGKKKDKEKTKTAKQMQSVVKSFGSIGKTMSKKFKTLGGGKGFKGEEDDKKSSKIGRKPSTGSATQSTKTSSSLTAELLKDKDHILCSKLLHTRLDYQDKMVQNYLQAARENFDQDRVIRKQQDDEMRLIAQRRKQEQERQVACINAGCDGIATPARSYLCSQCYDRQRKEALDYENHPKSEVDGLANGAVNYAKPSQIQSNASSKKHSESQSSNSGELQRQNTMVNLGSSKFYTYADEDQSVSLPSHKFEQQTSGNILRNHNSMLNNMSSKQDNKVEKAPLVLSRSSFYDEPLSAATRPMSGPRTVPPGTAMVINNLREEDFGTYDLHKNQGYQRHPGSQGNTYTINDSPRTHTPYRQNASTSYDHRNIETTYIPKVSNTTLKSGYQEYDSQMDHKLKSKCVMSDNGDQPGRYVSRIQVGGSSPVMSRGQQHECRTASCQEVGYFESSDFFCRSCFNLRNREMQYEQERTTFL